MAIALDYLRRNGCRLQAQARADFLFNLRSEMGKNSNRAGELSHAHAFSGGLESRYVAPRLRIPVGQLKSKRNRFGVNSVGSPHHGRVFELPGTAFEHFR